MSTPTITEILTSLAHRWMLLEADVDRMRGALQSLGADRCDRCGEWSANWWRCRDRCMCNGCLIADPEFPLLPESLTMEEFHEIEDSVVKHLCGLGKGKIAAANPRLRQTYLEHTQRTT